jgi:hypothetical protein
MIAENNRFLAGPFPGSSGDSGITDPEKNIN